MRSWLAVITRCFCLRCPIHFWQTGMVRAAIAQGMCILLYMCVQQRKPLRAWTLHSAHTLEISHGGGLKQFHESKSRLLAVWAIKLKPSGFLLISSLPATLIALL